MVLFAGVGLPKSTMTGLPLLVGFLMYSAYELTPVSWSTDGLNPIPHGRVAV